MPDTNAYLLLGLAVVFTILGGYFGSVVLRFQNALKDARALAQLQDD